MPLSATATGDWLVFTPARGWFLVRPLQAAEREGVQRSVLVQEAIRALLFVRRYRAVREEMVAFAQDRGVHTDDDVANLIS